MSFKTIRREAEQYFGSSRAEITFSDDPWHIDATGQLVEVQGPDSCAWSTDGNVGWGIDCRPDQDLWLSTGAVPFVGTTLPVSGWTSGQPWITFSVEGASKARIIYSADGTSGDGILAGIYNNGQKIAEINFFQSDLIGRNWDLQYEIDIPNADATELTIAFESLNNDARIPWMNLDAVELVINDTSQDSIDKNSLIHTNELLPRWMKLYWDSSSEFRKIINSVIDSPINRINSVISTERESIFPQDIPLGLPRKAWKLQSSMAGELVVTLNYGGETTTIDRVSDEWSFMQATNPVFLLRPVGGEIWFRNLAIIQSTISKVNGKYVLPDLDEESNIWYRELSDSSWTLIKAGDTIVNGTAVALPNTNSLEFRYQGNSKSHAITLIGRVNISSYNKNVTQKLSLFSLPSKMDSWASMFGITRLDGEDQSNLLSRILSVSKVKSGSQKYNLIFGIGRDLGFLDIGYWDGLSTYTIPFNKIRYVNVEDLPEYEYIQNEVGRPLLNRTKVVLNRIGTLYSIKVDGVLVNDNNKPLISGRTLTFDNPVGKVEVSYKVNNYSLQYDESGYITAIVPANDISLSGRHVYCISSINAWNITDSAYESSLYSGEGLPTSLLYNLASKINKSSDISLSSAKWNQGSENWFDLLELDKPTTYFLPALFDPEDKL